MIVGITGTNGAGKGTIVDFLKSREFKHYSVREYLAEEIGFRGLELTRDNLVAIANDLRAKKGASFIVEELYSRAKAVGGDAVIESIRNVGEVEALKKKGNFVLFAVDANPKLRYQRIIERKGVTDDLSYEDFVREETREMFSNDPSKQNISGCISLADHRFRNDSTIDDLKKKVFAVLGNRGPGVKKTIRPSWDEYFMEITRAVASRCTCDRGMSSAVIAKDKQILVTGYAGSPRGLPHCDEAGHQMEEWEHSDGVKRMHCVRTTHAEQNAICQAAKLGVPIDGATIYCKMIPCQVCAKMIINAGIKRVVCEKVYHAGGETENLFKKAGIMFEVLNKEVEKYLGQ